MMTTQELKDRARRQLAAIPACECRQPEPERRLVGVFSLVVCASCGGRTRERGTRPGYLDARTVEAKVS